MHQIIKYCFLLLSLMVAPCLQAAPYCSQWKAKVISIQGKVDFQRSGDNYWTLLKQDDKFCSGDKVRTSRHSRATIQLDNNTLITLNQSTTLNISIPEVKTSPWFIDLFEGDAFFRSRQQQKLNIHTPFINAAHEGTEFLVSVNSQQTAISVFDGQVSATNPLGKISIKKGYRGIANNNSPPQVQALKIDLEDAVQWTLYYPPIIDTQDYLNTTPATFLPAINAYQQGNIQQAITLLDKSTAGQNDTIYLTLKSSLLLSIGRTDEASTLLDRLLSLDKNHSSALALQSIIALAKNRKDKALILAQQAVTQNPQSAVAHIALSYAQQAHFKIESAQSSVQTAVELSPKNALAWVRLSELQLSSGDQNQALKSAKNAQQLNPNLSRTLSILGFTHLAQINIKQALSSFRQAINLESTDPLAHLGLGLAKIRKGDIEEGTRHIEIATSLDPNNATLRSYLGKAYYELRNNDYASTELAIAKEMDPNDPTPWFYDGILKQSANRPIEALHDMQKAIELNDNRGIYRSKLLLDEDAAARSVNLSRIYQDLGFNRVALKQSWNALALNPANHSAHRYLSDSLLGKPSHRIARASELLQAQLLQPINITPVQPQLTAENISILNSTGPSNLSSGEYDTLFSSNKAHLLLNGAYGSNNTLTDNAIISAIYNKLSLSFGQFHFQTDGFRQNDDYKQDTYNAFLQYAISPDFSIQLEVKTEDTRNGDTPFRLNQFHRENWRQSTEHDTARIGAHLRIDPKQDILLSAFYTTLNDSINNHTFNTDNPNPFNHYNQTSQRAAEDKGYQVELQHIFHSNNFDFTTGLGYLDLTNNTSLNTVGRWTEPPPTIISSLTSSSTSRDKTQYFNAYLYSKQNLLAGLTSILGLSFDSYEFDKINKQQLNPKLGLIWSPLNNLTFRAAAFRTLKRPFTTNPTIEPTQIAGFNQFFDSFDGTSAWQYAGGIDYQPLSNLFLGGEIYWRDTIEPFMSNNTATIRNRTKNSHIAYLYWTPAKWLAFSAEYQFDKFTRGFIANQGNRTDPQSVQTQQIPLTVNFFHSSGIFTKLSATYVDQKVTSVRNLDGLPSNTPPLETDNKYFWTFDSSIGYRLPKKYGLISVEVRNVFDNNFFYQSAFDAGGPQLSPFVPEREIFIKLNLSF